MPPRHDQTDEHALNQALQALLGRHGEEPVALTRAIVQQAIQVWNEFSWLPREIEPPHDCLILFQTDCDAWGISEYDIAEWNNDQWEFRGFPPKTPYTRWRFI
jgi:hypothetical protein